MTTNPPILLNGDCLELMKQIPDGKIDMILCDLPYGTTSMAWDTVIPFDQLWEQYNRIIKPKGNIVLFGSQPFTSLLVASTLKGSVSRLYGTRTNVAAQDLRKSA